MNNKMAKNIHTYQQLNLKNKLSKQEEQRQNHVFGERFDGCQMGRRYGGMGETVKQLQNSHGDVKYSIGNEVVEELIRMTQGHEQWWED